jgi:ATP-dependent DNA helicase RecG
MSLNNFETLLRHLLSLPYETEWVEFKHNNSDPEEIGQYVSALSNAAALHEKSSGYMIWGIEDLTHRIVGTTFQPWKKKESNQSIEHWLANLLSPNLDLRFHAIEIDGFQVVLLEIPPAREVPVRFKSKEYIRIGETKTELSRHPDKEKALWEIFRNASFENDMAVENLRDENVLSLLDYHAFFTMMNQAIPEDRQVVLERLEAENFVIRKASGYSITNMGAILFARDLGQFSRLDRKTLRIISYRGKNKIETLRERSAGKKGYAIDFVDAIRYINEQLPSNEQIGQALRREVPLYPELAIRELVANALIHQNFSILGAGPVVEIYSDRIEITSPGTPLIAVERFIDLPPRSRNDHIASFMRRINTAVFHLT